MKLIIMKLNMSKYMCNIQCIHGLYNWLKIVINYGMSNAIKNNHEHFDIKYDMKVDYKFHVFNFYS
jgi:hypothetical protein